MFGIDLLLYVDDHDDASFPTSPGIGLSLGYLPQSSDGFGWVYTLLEPRAEL